MSNPFKHTEPKSKSWEELERDLIVKYCSLQSPLDLESVENDIQKIKDMVYLPKIIKFLKHYNSMISVVYYKQYINERISKYEKDLADYEDEKRKLIEQELIE